MGVTAIILSCLYNDKEFFRVGYYVNNLYENEELNQNPPEEVMIDYVKRSLLADKPRIFKFNIDWNSTNGNIPSYSNYMFNDTVGQENFGLSFGSEKKNNDAFEKNLFN